MKKTALVLATLLFPLLSNATTIEGGINIWRENLTGWVEYTKNTSFITSKTHVDVKEDLNLSDETKSAGWLSIKDIPIPFIPDIKISYTPISFSGSGIATTSFTFGGITVPTGSYVDAKLEANQLDVLLFKTLNLPLFSVEAGLNTKIVDFQTKVKYAGISGIEEDSKEATIPIPMVHLGGNLVPIKSISIGIEGNWIGYSGSDFYELQGDIRYFPLKNLFVGLGYRYQRLKIDDINDISADIKLKGITLEAGLRF